jgi:hypothetical protein
MATKRTTKTAKRSKAATPRSKIRQASVKEAVNWLSQPAIGEQKFDRVIAAIRDPLDAHRLVTIVIHE